MSSDEPVSINDDELNAYITKRILDEFHYKLSPRVVSIILELESDYYEEMGLSMSAEDHQKEMETIDMKWSLALSSVDSIVKDLAHIENGFKENIFSAQTEANALQEVLKELSGESE